MNGKNYFTIFFNKKGQFKYGKVVRYYDEQNQYNTNNKLVGILIKRPYSHSSYPYYCLRALLIFKALKD